MRLLPIRFATGMFAIYRDICVCCMLALFSNFSVPRHRLQPITQGYINMRLEVDCEVDRHGGDIFCRAVRPSCMLSSNVYDRRLLGRKQTYMTTRDQVQLNRICRSRINHESS